MTEKPLEILMVEDNPADVRLTQLAFHKGKIHNRMSVVKDGVEAMAFLRRQNGYAGAARPDVIFLDLNLPRKDGREVLAEIKADADLKRIPVVVLTTSHAQNDILHAYDLHANCYIAKPSDLDQFLELIRQVECFWLSTVTLPPS